MKLLVLVIPTLLGTALQKSWFGSAYNSLSPIAQARLALENMIVGKEAFLLQLPHVGVLAAFVVGAGVFAALATRGVPPEGDGWLEDREDLKPWDPPRARSRTNEPAHVPRSQKQE